MTFVFGTLSLFEVVEMNTWKKYVLICVATLCCTSFWCATILQPTPSIIRLMVSIASAVVSIYAWPSLRAMVQKRRQIEAETLR